MVLTGCQREATTYARFDPRELSKAPLEAAKGNPSTTLQPLPDKLNSQYLPEDYRKGAAAPKEDPAKTPLANNATQIKLSLREMAQRLVANNLNVKVSGYQPRNRRNPASPKPTLGLIRLCSVILVTIPSVTIPCSLLLRIVSHGI